MRCAGLGAITLRFRNRASHAGRRPRAPVVAAASLLAAAALLAGCSSDTGLGGAEVPNAYPDTRLVGRPPVLRESSFIVRFAWTGDDTDGRIRGFQWKLSDNGLDGICLEDTLSVDPATGDPLHPWRFTAAHDSTFIVSADIPELPQDQGLPLRDRRSYQTHTLFVRAVDDDGAVDPTPALMSFTATTFTPIINVDRPAGMTSYKTAQYAPPSVTFGWTGDDPDGKERAPTKVRYLWKPARLPNGQYMTTKYDFDQNTEAVCSFSDSAWSEWLPYERAVDRRTITFRNQPQKDPQGRNIAYIFAIQATDTAGAVSPERVYSRNVHNVVISTMMTPLLTVFENYLGTNQSTGTIGQFAYDIAQGQPVQFTWNATADNYAGTVVAYRYGWDVADPLNESDSGWAVPAGNTPQHRRTPVTSFVSGSHTLTVEAVDDSGQRTRMTVILNVVPVPQPQDQYPLLLVDDVVDRSSHGWVGSDGGEHDRDPYRDTFWLEALNGVGGVAGFLPSRDVIDLEENRNFGYRDIVRYRSVIWTAKKSDTQSYIWASFAPTPGERFVWLEPYQERVGNLLLCGQQVLLSFLGNSGMTTDIDPGVPWIMPIILDTRETYFEIVGDWNIQRFALGLGTRVLPDGTTVLLGTRRYPFTAWGIDVLDQPSIINLLYPGAASAAHARKSNCAGLMGLVLDGGFKASHLSQGDIADTILTWSVVDPADYPSGTAYPDLHAPFPWGLDEFYDTNVTPRTTAWMPQVLPDGRAAIEPMFRFLSRYDWIRRVHEQRGDPGWPLNTNSTDRRDIFGYETLRSTCSSGEAGAGPLFRLDLTTVLDGAPVGFVSHKKELFKPGHRGDVLWGFDPSRFDPGPMQRAIRWTLAEQFGLRMTQ